ncbi:MAG: hypothetical protein QW478_15095 [Candidatus Micrarchaeaceae archaeon]
MKFSKIVEPPEGGFTNTTNSWILVVGISYLPTVNPNSPTITEDGVGVVRDEEGNIIDQMGFVEFQDYLYTPSSSTTSYPFSHSIGFMKSFVLVPPMYNIENFGYAMAFYLSYEEVEEFLKNSANVIMSGKVMYP